MFIGKNRKFEGYKKWFETLDVRERIEFLQERFSEALPDDRKAIQEDIDLMNVGL